MRLLLSSCMHFNLTVATMESEVEGGFSRNTCGKEEADSCSFSAVNGACDDRKHASSETTNLQSATSTHNQTDVIARSQFLSYTDLHPLASSRVEEQHVLDCHGDNNLDLEKKDPTHSALTCSLVAEGIETAVQDEAAHGYHDRENEQGQRPQMQPQAISETESENSAAIEDDVKVCDICGDAGQEELLAICSRCSDGAEHTYCMRTMLDELPEGDWLCEECKLKEETKNQKVDKSETIDPKILPKLVTKAPDQETSWPSKEPGSPQISDERHARIAEGSSLTSRKASETNGRSKETSTPRKQAGFYHEGSSSNLDIERINPSMLADSSQTLARSQACPVSNSSRGPLLKSVSFNNSIMKPKVKQLTGNVPFMQKMIRGAASSNRRKLELLRKMTKSASFKGISSGYSNVDTRRVKQVKERNLMEKKDSSIIDHPLVRPTSRTITSIPLLKPDLQVAHTSESNILGVNGGSVNANDLVKKQSSYLSKSSSSPSPNEIANSEHQKQCQVVPNNDLRVNSTSVDKSFSEAHTLLHHSTCQDLESLYQDENTKDPIFFSSSKQVVSGGTQILHCQNCNETDHSSQYCSIDKFHKSFLKPSADQKLKEGTHESNKCSEAVEATKTKIQNSRKLINQSEKLLMSSTGMSSEVPSRNSLSSSPSCAKNLSSVEGTTDGQDILGRSITDSIKTGVVIDAETRSIHQVGPVSSPRASKLNSAPTIPETLMAKPSMQIIPGQASVLGNPLRALIIPELDFLWKGGFEVLKAGRCSELCDGIQAHLSSCASTKVLEVATKFPCTIQVNEVPRLSSWPLKFQGSSPKENNIALFFFAKDIDSYEKNFRNLLENMLQNDLALKGNIDGIELLIFPSNTLPENSQRWNRLYFLWGVFIGRRTNCLGTLPVSQEKPGGLTLNADPLSTSLTFKVSTDEKTNSTENQDKEVSMCDESESSKAKAVKPIKCMDLQPISSSGIKDRICHTQESHQSQAVVDNGLQSEHTKCSFPNNFVMDSDGGKDVARVHPSTTNGKQGAEASRGEEEQRSIEGGTVLDTDLGEDLMEIDCLSWKSSLERKHALSASTNTSSRTSDGTFESTGETMQRSNKGNLNNSSHSEAKMAESSRSAERHFFPVDLGVVKDAKPNDFIFLASSDDEDSPESDVPDLELALGGEKRSPEQDTLRLSSPKIGKRSDRAKLAGPSVDEKDDGLASLSLSLAFGKGETPKDT